MNKKILIIRNYTGYGGIEHQIENITKYLIQKDWKVFFLSNIESPLSKELERLQAEVVIEKFSGALKTALIINELCRRNKIQLIQSHVLKDSFICRIAKLLQPSLKHIYRVHTYIDCSHISDFKKNLYHFADKITSLWVNCYLSINEYNVNEMLKRSYLSKRKIRIAHDMLTISIRDDFTQCSYKNNHIAMIANFVDFKGHDVLLEGLKILHERGINITAHLIGGIPNSGTGLEDYSRLNIVKDTIQKYNLEDFIIMEGYQSDIVKSLEHCGMIVLPSDAEGTPNVLLEGMALGKIVIASNVGGIPEFVIEGQTGFLHEARNPYSFADAIIRAYSTSEMELSIIAHTAFQLIGEQYTVKSVMDVLIREYSVLLKNRGDISYEK